MPWRSVRAAIVVLATGFAVAGCGSGTDSVIAEARTFGWDALPSAPLSPRTNSAAAWMGKEALFFGGETDGFCPPNAACIKAPTMVADGAAYDLAARTWRRVADAPMPLAGPTAPAVLGEAVFLIAGDGTLLAYDVRADRWIDHGAVPAGTRYSPLTATGDGRLVLAWSGESSESARDHVYDPRNRTWAEVPKPPTPLARDVYRRYAAIPAGLVLFGGVDSGRPDRPDLVDAAVLDLATGTWRELPMSAQIGANFHWTGTRLVSPLLDGADGGKVNGWGRTYYYGGTLDLATGTWGPLPNAPKKFGDGWRVNATGGRWTATGGWVYDDAEETWTLLPRPAGASWGAGTAVWADDVLIAFGGTPEFGPGGVTGPTNAAWSYQIN